MRIIPPKFSSMGIIEQIFRSSHRSPHMQTLEQEFMFGEGDDVPYAYIFQTRENLQRTKLFRSVRFRYDTTLLKRLDVYIDLEERPHIVPFLRAETGGGAATLGIGADAVRAGEIEGFWVRGECAYYMLNTIGVEGSIALESRRVFDALDMRLSASANRFRNAQMLHVLIPFSLESPDWESSFTLSRVAGAEFVYNNIQSADVLDPAPFSFSQMESYRLAAYTTVRGWHWYDEFFLMGYAALDYTKREAPSLRRRIGDNSIQVFGGIGLEHRNEDNTMGNSISSGASWWKRYGNPTTGWYGRMWIGIIRSESVLLSGIPYSIRAGTQQIIGDRLCVRLHGELSGYLGKREAMGFDEPGLLYGHIKAGAAIRLWQDVIFASHCRLEAAHSVLRPQNGAGEVDGVRGYGMNMMIGSFRNILQFEIRGLPLAVVGNYRLTGALFADFGSYLREDSVVGFNQPYRHVSSCGAGLRLHFPSALAAGESTLRLDLAFVPERMRFGQIIIAAQEAFCILEDFPAKQERILREQRWIE